MNYSKIYDQIIDRAIERNLQYSKTLYTEQHHIIPYSLGGSNNKENLVRLLAKEHFICHYLLYKMYKRKTYEWYKMTNAFLYMFSSSNSHKRVTSRIYDKLKLDVSIAQSYNQQGNKNSLYGKHWWYDTSNNENILSIEKPNDNCILGRIVNTDEENLEKRINRYKTIKLKNENYEQYKKERCDRIFLKTYEIGYSKTYKWLEDYIESNLNSLNLFAKSVNINQPVILNNFKKYFKNYYEKIAIQGRPFTNQNAKMLLLMLNEI